MPGPGPTHSGAKNVLSGYAWQPVGCCRPSRAGLLLEGQLTQHTHCAMSKGGGSASGNERPDCVLLLCRRWVIHVMWCDSLGQVNSDVNPETQQKTKRACCSLCTESVCRTLPSMGQGTQSRDRAVR